MQVEGNVLTGERSPLARFCVAYCAPGYAGNRHFSTLESALVAYAEDVAMAQGGAPCLVEETVDFDEQIIRRTVIRLLRKNGKPGTRRFIVQISRM